MLCLIVGSLLPTVLFAALLLRGLVQFTSAVAYREVAHQLGLSADSRGGMLHGWLGDKRVFIGTRWVVDGNVRSAHHGGLLDFERPLGLGLEVRRRGLSERWLRRRRRTGAEILLGDPALDRLLEVRTSEPERAKALLTGPALVPLRRLVSGWKNVAIADQGLRVVLSRPEPTAGRLMGLLQSMVDLAAALEEARARLPAPERFGALGQRWEALAKDLGVDYEPAWPAIRGERDGRRLLVVPHRRSTDEFNAVARLFFRPHRAIGLRIVPDEGGAVGDQEIRGWDAEAVRERIAPGEPALKALAAHGRVYVDDRCITLSRIDGDPENLAHVIAHLEDFARAIGW